VSKYSLPSRVGANVTEKDANTSGYMSTRQMAAVIGVPYEQVLAEHARQRGNTPDGNEFTFTIPGAWVRRGRKRTASTGMTDFADQVQVLDVMDTPDGRWVDRNGAIWTRVELRRGVPLMSTPGSTVSAAQSHLAVQQVVALFGPLHLLGMRVGDL
jgi:hypothetical protein